jgi:large subunit ribosomal protein L23
MDQFSILRRPVITEKSTFMQDERKYTFEVAPRATKLQIKQAVEHAFEVTVVKVNTMNVQGKLKRFGPRVSRRPSVKKAIVTLAPGNTITIFEGV